MWWWFPRPREVGSRPAFFQACEWPPGAGWCGVCCWQRESQCVGHGGSGGAAGRGRLCWEGAAVCLHRDVRSRGLCPLCAGACGGGGEPCACVCVAHVRKKAWEAAVLCRWLWIVGSVTLHHAAPAAGIVMSQASHGCVSAVVDGRQLSVEVVGRWRLWAAAGAVVRGRFVLCRASPTVERVCRT